MVQSTIENVSETKRKINITVPQDKVLSFYNKASQKVSNKAKIKGFRPGKIPAKMLEQQYGPEIDMECLNNLVDDTFNAALTEHAIYPLSKPDFQVTPMTKGVEYKFAVEFEVKPTFELKTYKGITLKEVKIEVTDEQIQKELSNIQENMADLESAPEGAELKSGMVCTIDFAGKVDGVPFDGGQAKDYQLQYGKGQFLQDFEEQIAGMKSGETRTIKVVFPKDYFQKSLAGQDATFEVTVKALHNKKLPAIDDELAKDIGKKDLAELKDEIKKLLEENQKANARREYVNQLNEYFLKEYTFELPHKFIQEEQARTKRPLKELQEQIRNEFILEEIAKIENIQPTPEDLQQKLFAYSQMYRKPLEEIQKMFLNERMMPHLISSIIVDKTFDLLIEHAKKS